MPKAVATMLDALNIRAGAGGSYLDVGTGTGYTAARIAELVGESGSVTTIEVDPGPAESAHANVARAGVARVEVITGDGFEGWEAAAPYDGVHVMCGIRRISPRWVRQCRPGAKIVLPWGTDYTPHNRLLTLTVNDDRTASGYFGVGLSFMKMRSQRLAFAGHRAYTPDGWQNAARETDSDLEPAEAKEVLDGDGAFAVSVRVPDCVMNAAHEDDGSVSIWLYSTRDDRSVAVGAFGDGYAPNITQAGPRALWDEVALAREWWVQRDRPKAERFGLTVGGDEQRIWLGRR